MVTNWVPVPTEREGLKILPDFQPQRQKMDEVNGDHGASFRTSSVGQQSRTLPLEVGLKITRKSGTSYR